MRDQNKSPLAPTSGQSTNNNRRAHLTKPAQKWKRVLVAMAEGALNDHCLHSTVSTVQAKGVQIERRDEVVPVYQDMPTHVCRYWLAPENTDRVLNLLGLSKWHAAG